MHSDTPILLDLSYKGLIRASGPDTVAFLQGQFSTDIEKLTHDLSQVTSWSNAKGRVVTLMRLFYRDDDIYIALAASLKPLLLKRLAMYVLRSKLTLTDAGDGLSTLGLIGEGAPALLRQSGLPVPALMNGVTRSDGFQVIGLQGALPRYVVYGDNQAVGKLKQRWQAVTIPGTEDLWALHKILASEPTVYPETSEHFVAQMLDLDKLGAVDFKKGCYTGQEVIARAHYRGGVKRHLARAESRGDAPFKAGADIHAQGQDSPVAEVVDARLDAHSVWQMLVVIQDDARNMNLVHTASGAAVKLI